MPTHVHVRETANCQAGGAPTWIDSSAHDWLARATVVLVFSLLVFASVSGALQIALDSGHQPLDRTLLQIAARASNALFLALVAATAVTRLRPLRKAAGIEPRLSALLGTFLLISLAVLPRAELPPIAVAISSVLVIVGLSASFMVLRWLGKSFSIMAEARGARYARPLRAGAPPALYLRRNCSDRTVHPGHVAGGVPHRHGARSVPVPAHAQ